MRDVYIIGTFMMRFGKYPEMTIKTMVAKAFEGVIKEADIKKSEIDSVWFSNSGWGRRSGQDCIRGQVALRPLGIGDVPIVNVENACAGGSTALHGAWVGIGSGLYETALAVGAEKIFHHDRNLMFAGFLGGLDVENIKGLIEMKDEIEKSLGPSGDFPEGEKDSRERKSKNPLGRITKFTGLLKDRVASIPTLIKDAVILENLFGWETLKLLARQGMARDRSPFMDVYAFAARMHMEKYGTTLEQLATIASKNHFHSSLNPLAQYQIDMSVEEVIRDRPVSFPLTRAMCAPIGDGAAAALLCSGDFLKGLKKSRPVKFRGSVVGSGMDRPWDGEDIGLRLGRRLYELTGVGPEDIDVAELHDATAFGELHHTETLGFCKEGEGGMLAESGATRLGGRIPINTSGGLECRGHPIGASGIAQIHELVTQLRGKAGKRQVPGARLALAQNGGGNIGVEEAAMVVTLLERVE